MFDSWRFGIVLFQLKSTFFPFRVYGSDKYWFLSSPRSTGSSFETNSHHRPIHFNNSGQSVESVNDGFSSYLVSHSLTLTALPPQTNCKQTNRDRKFISTIFTPIECCSLPAILSPESLRELCALCLFWNQRTKAPLTRSDSGNSDDNYVPMNPGSSPLSAAQADSPKNIYIPMSPGPHHFDFPGFSATLPARKGSSASLCHRPSRLSDVTPPPINRNLKPNRKCEFLTASSHWSKSMFFHFF